MTDIPLTPVEGSTSISAHGYDPETRTLRVQFKTGATYDHPNFPLEKYAAMTGADSMGRYYNTRIRDVHDARKLKDGN